MTEAEHAVADQQPLTHGDLRNMMSELKTLLLKWLLGVGFGIVVAGTGGWLRLEARVSNTEARNRSDSTQLSALDIQGSQPLRNLTHDLTETRQQMANLQSEIAGLSGMVTELRIQIARSQKVR